jgi:hypothetical protein
LNSFPVNKSSNEEYFYEKHEKKNFFFRFLLKEKRAVKKWKLQYFYIILMTLLIEWNMNCQMVEWILWWVFSCEYFMGKFSGKSMKYIFQLWEIFPVRGNSVKILNKNKLKISSKQEHSKMSDTKWLIYINYSSNLMLSSPKIAKLKLIFTH